MTKIGSLTIYQAAELSDDITAISIACRKACKLLKINPDTNFGDALDSLKGSQLSLARALRVKAKYKDICKHYSLSDANGGTNHSRARAHIQFLYSVKSM